MKSVETLDVSESSKRSRTCPVVLESTRSMVQIGLWKRPFMFQNARRRLSLFGSQVSFDVLDTGRTAAAPAASGAKKRDASAAFDGAQENNSGGQFFWGAAARGRDDARPTKRQELNLTTCTLFVGGLSFRVDDGPVRRMLDKALGESCRARASTHEETSKNDKRKIESARNAR